MYEIFEQLCQNKGVTPNQVSVATGIRSSAFTDWKHGRSIPKTDKLIKIADYFHVPLDYLLTGNSQVQNNDEIRILFTRTEAIHSMISEFAVDGDQRTIDLVYSILQREWSDEQLDLLIGYCDKLNDDQRWFVNTPCRTWQKASWRILSTKQRNYLAVVKYWVRKYNNRNP